MYNWPPRPVAILVLSLPLYCTFRIFPNFFIIVIELLQKRLNCDHDEYVLLPVTRNA